MKICNKRDKNLCSGCNAIRETKIYVPVVTLSTHKNPKLLQQLKSGFIRLFNCNKYQSKISKKRKKNI